MNEKRTTFDRDLTEVTETTKPVKHRRLTVFTNSEAQSFRDCSTKHGFAYAAGLRPKVAPRALSFGKAFHAGTEAYRRAIGTVPEDEVKELALASGHAAIQHSFVEWLAKAEEESSNLEELYTYAKSAVEDASWMFEHYVKTFAQDIQRLVPLAIERPFLVAMRNTIGRVVPHMQYQGVWDLVAYDALHGDIVIFDDKTTKGDISGIDRRVELDPQMAGYLVALRELLATDPESFIRAIGPMHRYAKEAATVLREHRAGVGRIAYNVVRKKRPTTPKTNKDGTISIAEIDTFAELYEAALRTQGDPEWLVKAYANRGAKGGSEKWLEQTERWDELRAKQARIVEQLRAKGDTFIGRREFFRSPDEIERWRREFFVLARHIRAAELNPALRYRNPGHCTMPWSMPCVYRGICLDDAPELRAQFEIQPRHVEVEEARKHDSDEED